MSALAGMLASALPAVTAEIPSPSVGVWHLGPLPIRGYALCILAGIVVAVWLTQRRLEARGYQPGVAVDVSAWAVPFGILGGRLYHLITTPQPYFGKGGNPWKAFAVYEGGLGIWGAVALGAFGAWLGCRKNGVRFADFVDSAAPGLAIAQAMGRFGNWFNNEIYGAPTDLPWKLRIYEWDTSTGHAVLDAAGNPVVKGFFHPTFLYESLFCLALAAVLVQLGRRRQLRPGQTFAAYVMGYPVGRIVIENMRTDSANLIFGQRVNTWVSILVFLLGVWLWRRAGRSDAVAGPPAPTSSPTASPGEQPDDASAEPSEKASEKASGKPSDDLSDAPVDTTASTADTGRSRPSADA